MAEAFIEEIYHKAQMIPGMKRLVEYCRRGQSILLFQEWAKMQEVMADFCKDACIMEERLGSALWDGLVEVREKLNHDMLSEAADQLEELLDLAFQAMKPYCTIDVEEGNYRIFSSKSGYLSLKDTEGDRTLTSRIDPVWEGLEKARALYSPKMREFCTLGCELGYLCWQIYEYSNESIDIYVYDLDKTVINYAMQFGVLGNIPKDRLHIVTDSNADKLMEKYADHLDDYKQDLAVLHYEPDVLKKMSENGKAIFERISSMIETTKGFRKISEMNYYRNRHNVDRTFRDLRLNREESRWVVIGGGPSVDDKLQYIRMMQGKKILIAASTIARRLLDAGIRPDYIAVIDPQNRTFGHMKGMEQCDIPLIMTDKANWQFGEKYKGEKYLVPLSGDFFAEEFCSLEEEKGEKRWYGQGTVSAFAIEIAVRLGASSIEFIGIDLAFPGGNSHAKGTMDFSTVNETGLLSVPSVNGNRVYTSRIFLNYIKELEDFIEVHPRVRFYNHSSQGALIRGCRNLKELNEII